MRRFFKYIQPYLLVCLAAQLFMVGEVAMDLIQPQFMRAIVDEGILGLGESSSDADSLELIITNGVYMIVTVVLGAFFGVVAGILSNIASQNFGTDVRNACFRRVLDLSFEQVDRFSTGTLVTRLTNDVTQLEAVVPSLTRGGVRASVFFIGGIGCMLAMSMSFGAAIACALPFIVALVVYVLVRATPVYAALQERLDRVNAVMQENVSGARVVRAYVQEPREEERFRAANAELVRTQQDALELVALLSPVMNIVMNLAVVAIIKIGSIEVQAGAITPGIVMSAITYSSLILNSVSSFANIFQNLTRGAASAARLGELLDTEPAIKDGPGAEPVEPGAVEFRDVSFCYPGQREPALSHVDLRIEPGETFAIMGATGAGKSSLVQLIPRFYDATAGTVLVGGVDVRSYTLAQLREQVGIALQQSELFRGSIEENIALGRPGASREEVAAAAATAQATEFIERKAEGFGTQVAERGSSLSGGQKQRIAVARAVLKGAGILVLDDSTSALDLQTEAELYDALDAAAPGTTKIIIAQRIASVRRASRIAIIEDNTVVACAPHEELLRSSAVYRDIYRSQLKGAEDE